MKPIKILPFLAIAFSVMSCNDNNEDNYTAITETYPAVLAEFGSSVDLNNLANYANQTVPAYITKDNSALNPISNKGATLGRVLFYDKKMSSNNTVSCSSCHKQALAFGDDNIASTGVNGTTGRHSMRLINTRFSVESKFFWDERAASLEVQTTMPIKDHGEMGYSGTNGDANFSALITKLSAINYYKELFKFAYGTEEITETKIQFALAQFIRSIQSFDSKYDVGRAGAPNDGAPFANFTAQENQGKNLFLTPPTFNASGVRTAGGLGCAGCHAAPEFDIDPNSRNNGFIGVIGSTNTDLTNTRSPSLRDILNAAGLANTPFMHTAASATIRQVLNHYNTIAANPRNTNLDARLKPNNIGQNLQMTPDEINSMVAFLRTLTGKDVYTNKKWGNPFL